MRKIRKFVLPVIVLLLYFIAGLWVLRDYGASTDEHVQVEGGHVMWDYVMGTLFGKEAAFPELPPLDTFQNRYYGQAATFPTVLIEALRGFRSDSSTVIRIRHLWNFLTFFIALVCFAGLLTLQGYGQITVSIGLLLMILLPKIFGDVFYNDRDVMLLSWMLIALFGFAVFERRPNFGTALLAALTLTIAINTRIFALMLLALPGFYLLRAEREKKKYALIIFALICAFWLALYPMAWKNPLKTLPEALHHFRTQQRSQDTNDAGELLFMGKMEPENHLPWYYLPVWMLISTPLMTTALFIYGVFKRRKGIISDTLLMILALCFTAVIALRLTLYNGWRHFYFLYIPIVYFAVEAVDRLLRCPRKFLCVAGSVLIAASFADSIAWMAKNHPYEIVYFNPAFRKSAPGNFDRDYWMITTSELMEQLAARSDALVLNVVDYRTFVGYTNIGMSPRIRERLNVMGYSEQRSPYEYLFYNYSNAIGNHAVFSYYDTIYTIERDGVRLAEIQQRTHRDELRGADVIRAASGGSDALYDGDYDTYWSGAVPRDRDAYLTLELNGIYELESFEIFPGENAVDFADFTAEISEDGKRWETLALEPAGTNGFSFSPVRVRFLRLRDSAASEYPRSIREFLFYGKVVENLDEN